MACPRRTGVAFIWSEPRHGPILMKVESLDLASVLRCPCTGEELRWVDAQMWAGVEWGGRFEGWDGGLLRKSGAGMYPVRGGIPVLLEEEFVEIPDGDRARFKGEAKL